MSFTFAVQFLDPGVAPDSISTEEAVVRLRAAAEILPFAAVIVGQDLPEVVEEVHRIGAGAFRWQRPADGIVKGGYDGVFLDCSGEEQLDRAMIEAAIGTAHEAGLEIGLGFVFAPAIAQDVMLLDYHCDWMKIAVESADPQVLWAEMTRARETGISSLYAAVDLSGDNVVQQYRALRAAVPNGFILGPDLWRIPLENIKLIDSLRKTGSR